MTDKTDNLGECFTVISISGSLIKPGMDFSKRNIHVFSKEVLFDIVLRSATGKQKNEDSARKQKFE